MHTVIFSCIACIHFWICRKVCFICIFIKLFNFCWPHILIIFCHLPDAVNWVVFLVMRWHPVTWLQYSTVQFGEQLPPHLLPKLPGGQDSLQNVPKYPNVHSAWINNWSFSTNGDIYNYTLHSIVLFIAIDTIS